MKAEEATKNYIAVQNELLQKILLEIEEASKKGRDYITIEEPSIYILSELEKLGYITKICDYPTEPEPLRNLRGGCDDPILETIKYLVIWGIHKMDDKKEYATIPSNDKDDSGTLRHFRD